jgi:hypothetical protein
MAMQREVVQQVIKSYFYVATWMSIRSVRSKIHTFDRNWSASHVTH